MFTALQTFSETDEIVCWRIGIDFIDNEDIWAVTFQRIKAEVPNDTKLFRLMDALSNTPHDGGFPVDLCSYQWLCDHLNMQDGVPMYGRLVIFSGCHSILAWLVQGP